VQCGWIFHPYFKEGKVQLVTFTVQCGWIFHPYFKKGKVQLVTFTMLCGCIFHPDFERRENPVDPVTAAPACNLLQPTMGDKALGGFSTHIARCVGVWTLHGKG
jgi:hypothetical protein